MSEIKTEHDGCERCKYILSASEKVSYGDYCYECSNAHVSEKLNDKFVPMTNADMIRFMSDEELLMFLLYGINGIFADLKDDEQDCHDKIEKWLKSEANCDYTK